MRAGHDDPEGSQSEVPGANSDAGNANPPVVVFGRNDTDHPRSERQPQRSRLAGYFVGFPNHTMRNGCQLSIVLSITPITPRIHPMCLNVISSDSRATIRATVRIHTLPSSFVRLGSTILGYNPYPLIHPVTRIIKPRAE